MYRSRSHRPRSTALALIAILSLVASNAFSDVLSDNLENVTSGTESASSSRWLTAGFGTDASTHSLSSVTLLLANTLSGTASLDLYADGGLEPGTFAGTLNSPATYSSTLAETTFTAAGITLNANATYWIVLSVESGEFQWAWTADESGSGAGFQHTWGFSDDAGDAWWSYDTYPTQFSVSVDVGCTLTGDVNSDSQVDLSDLTVQLSHFGTLSGATLADGDLDGDGDVDLTDLALLLAHFGEVCP